MMDSQTRSEPMTSIVEDDCQTYAQSNGASDRCAESSSFRQSLTRDLIQREKKDDVSGDDHRIEGIVHVEESVRKPCKKHGKSSEHNRRGMEVGETEADGNSPANGPERSGDSAADGVGHGWL